MIHFNDTLLISQQIKQHRNIKNYLQDLTLENKIKKVQEDERKK